MNSIKTEIPIQNIYYMLSYAYNNLKINEKVLLDCVNFKNIHDLLARILIDGINKIIKRGFYKEYINENEDTLNLKGKINITSSIKRQTMIYKRLNCDYDEFSSDVLFNQIIKSSMDLLIRNRYLDNELKKKLKKLKPFFHDVSSIDLNKKIFKLLRWNKNNQHYSIIINICELIVLNEVPEDKDGKITFKDFIKNYEKEIARLFEEFVLNFYKKECKEIKAHAPKIKWNLDSSYGNTRGHEYLPNMRTDIILEHENKQLIIDTKFYKKIFSSYKGVDKLNSSNLYQICSYVNNSQFGGEISGMLLYASLGDDIDFEFKVGDNVFFIKTLNLNQDWEGIDEYLMDIAELIMV